MITEGKSADIVYGLCSSLGLPRYQGGSWDYSDEPRVIINSHRQETERKYLKNFIDVNVVFPDLANEPQMSNLKLYEKMLQDLFYGTLTGEVNGTGYVIELKSLGIEGDGTIKSHFVNCKLLFSALR